MKVLTVKTKAIAFQVKNMRRVKVVIKGEISQEVGTFTYVGALNFDRGG
jgi:hypothetical protein